MDEVIKKRILLITPDFGYGGAERSVAALSVLLASRYDVHYVVFNKHIEAVYLAGGTLHSLDVPAGRSTVGKIRAFIRRVIELKKIKRNINPAASISFLEGGDYINVLSRNQDKIIISLRGSKRHDHNIKGVTGWLRRKILIPFIYRKADHIAAVSHGLLAELREDFNLPEHVKQSVIPNFYDLELLQQKAKEDMDESWIGFFDQHVVFSAVGRLSYEKGFHLLANVFSDVVKARPSARLIIIGSGSFENQIQDVLRSKETSYSAAPEIDFQKSVIFMGYQANPLKWIARSKFFILSSFTEGFPNALLESMAAGVPVIAADCPYGPAEILSNPNDTGIFRTYGMLLPVLKDDESVLSIWRNHLIGLIDATLVTEQYKSAGISRVHDYNSGEALHKWINVIG